MNGETHPVAYMTTSASSSLPLSNFRPVFVKRSIWLSFLILILPSMISWLVPTSNTPPSAPRARFVRAIRTHRGSSLRPAS